MSGKKPGCDHRTNLTVQQMSVAPCAEPNPMTKEEPYMFLQKGGTRASVVWAAPHFLSSIDCPLFSSANSTQKLLQMSRLVDVSWLLEVLDVPSQQFADRIAKLLADRMVCSTNQLFMLEEPHVLSFPHLSHTFTSSLSRVASKPKCIPTT